MQLRKLGWTDLNITTIGLGTWAMGGSGWLFGWGHQNDEDSSATSHQSLSEGINWIDTAAAYGLGHSEVVVGEAIKGLTDKPIIATKCSRVWDKEGNLSGSLKKESIQSECEASLKRLKIEVIDLFQIHWPLPDEDIEEGWNAVANLVKEGKVRYGGVSNFSVEQLKRIQPIHPVASLQPPYSMLKRGIENQILDYCSKTDIGVIVYSPMQKGLLTGKMTRERIQNLPADDHRSKDPLFKDPVISNILDLVEDLRPIAENNNKTLAQLAIAWTLAHPIVTAAIVGARTTSQIKETVNAGDWILSKENLETIGEILGKYPPLPDIQPVRQQEKRRRLLKSNKKALF